MVSVKDEDICGYSALNECNRHPRYCDYYSQCEVLNTIFLL